MHNACQPDIHKRTVVVVLAVRLQTLGNVAADLLHGLLADLVGAQRGGHRAALDRALTERGPTVRYQ